MKLKMKRGAAVLACVALFTAALPAVAEEVVPIVFPVAGENHFSDTYGAPRSGGRTHEGIDIMADKMVPVVAAADGTVGWMQDERGGNCCAMELIHDDGYRSRYIHLNNDTENTDDGLGWGFAPGIASGVHVRAGQLIGWVGDSGNAEWTRPHLHFELRYPSGDSFDSYESLVAADPPPVPEADEMFFYRDDGLFRFYDVGEDGSLSEPFLSGDGYTTGWDAITTIDLNGDGQDEMFFYRDDGLFRFYELNPDGTLGSPLASGDGYTSGWSSIAAIDLDGDGQDEMFFYRDDGLFRFYDVKADGRIGAPVMAGAGYTVNWTSISAIDLDGDGQDEMFFYRDDGLFRFYDVNEDATLGSPLVAGDGYTANWTSISAIDLDGDGQDEMFFYRDDGLFRFYDIRTDGSLPGPMRAGADYTAGWNAITALDLG